MIPLDSFEEVARAHEHSQSRRHFILCVLPPAYPRTLILLADLWLDRNTDDAGLRSIPRRGWKSGCVDLHWPLPLEDEAYLIRWH
jgi:hypothetical protein